MPGLAREFGGPTRAGKYFDNVRVMLKEGCPDNMSEFGWLLRLQEKDIIFACEDSATRDRHVQFFRLVLKLIQSGFDQQVVAEVESFRFTLCSREELDPNENLDTMSSVCFEEENDYRLDLDDEDSPPRPAGTNNHQSASFSNKQQAITSPSNKNRKQPPDVWTAPPHNNGALGGSNSKEVCMDDGFQANEKLKYEVPLSQWDDCCELESIEVVPPLSVLPAKKEQVQVTKQQEVVVEAPKKEKTIRDKIEHSIQKRVHDQRMAQRLRHNELRDTVRNQRAESVLSNMLHSEVPLSVAVPKPSKLMKTGRLRFDPSAVPMSSFVAFYEQVLKVVHVSSDEHLVGVALASVDGLCLKSSGEAANMAGVSASMIQRARKLEAGSELLGVSVETDTDRSINFAFVEESFVTITVNKKSK